MAPDEDHYPESLVYKVGLDSAQEAVISSHFMQGLSENSSLQLYDERVFAAKALNIDARSVYDVLVPGMLSACNEFCRTRANAAKQRARRYYRRYELTDPGRVGTANFITEVMFDRQFLRGPRETCSRTLICDKVMERIEKCAAIEMVVPALPFKFATALKSRGRLPDLGEANFLLGLYEVARTIELIYKEARPDLQGTLGRFAVVSDGSRFNRLVNEPDSVITEYRTRLALWIKRLGLEAHITLLDYRTLLGSALPAVTKESKSAIAQRARREYSDALWPTFDPYDMAATFKVATMVEPDPEYGNPGGRFISLLKSLVYTHNYKTLEAHEKLGAPQYGALYRDLTGHIFKPYALLPETRPRTTLEESAPEVEFPATDVAKERLRQGMLREAWSAAIEYLSEIKSDRELEEDPITTCLPHHFRWTIHAKPGQLAILTPSALGFPIQAWAGAAVFKRSNKEKGKLKLCTLPVLALEGAGATPVMVSGVADDLLTLGGQPLFYIYPDVSLTRLDEFLSRIADSLGRKRTN